MASAQTPALVVQNENIHLHRGKAGNAGKSELNEKKKKKKGLGNRKALADLSKPGEPLPPQTKGTAILKAKPPPTTAAAADESTILADPLLTEEDIRKCKEWANEGIERLHCPCNHRKDVEDDLERKVLTDDLGMVMSSSGCWIPRDDDGLDSPRMEVSGDFEPISKLELEPVLALPCETRFSSISGGGDDDDEFDALLAEVWELCSFSDVDLVLKESDDEVAPQP